MGRSIPAADRGLKCIRAGWQNSEHSAQYLVLHEYRKAAEDAEIRLERRNQQVAEVVAIWSMAPVVEAYQALSEVALATAVTFVAEIEDVRQFASPRQLMAYCGNGRTNDDQRDSASDLAPHGLPMGDLGKVALA